MFLVFLQDNGRRLICIFMVLPSKKEYPDYYQVISEPIDMTLIEGKIKADRVRQCIIHTLKQVTPA